MNRATISEGDRTAGLDCNKGFLVHVDLEALATSTEMQYRQKRLKDEAVVHGWGTILNRNSN